MGCSPRFCLARLSRLGCCWIPLEAIWGRALGSPRADPERWLIEIISSLSVWIVGTILPSAGQADYVKRVGWWGIFEIWVLLCSPQAIQSMEPPLCRWLGRLLLLNEMSPKRQRRLKRSQRLYQLTWREQVEVLLNLVYERHLLCRRWGGRAKAIKLGLGLRCCLTCSGWSIYLWWILRELQSHYMA